MLQPCSLLGHSSVSCQVREQKARRQRRGRGTRRPSRPETRRSRKTLEFRRRREQGVSGELRGARPDVVSHFGRMMRQVPECQTRWAGGTGRLGKTHCEPSRLLQVYGPRGRGGAARQASVDMLRPAHFGPGTWLLGKLRRPDWRQALEQ